MVVNFEDTNFQGISGTLEMLVNVIATVECDRCGKRCKVDVDPAMKPMEGWTVFECVQEAVRNGEVFAERPVFLEGGRHVCSTCEVPSE